MARRTALAEATKLIEQFFDETLEGYWKDIRATRIDTRRQALMDQVDMFDKVRGRAYAWLTSRGASNG